MKKFFNALGWLIVLVILLLISLAIAVVFSWPTFYGLFLFVGLLILMLVVRALITLIPLGINKIRQNRQFFQPGKNRLQRLLFKHWWEGAQLQSWRRFLSLFKSQRRPPPWYIVIGEEEANKQALLSHCNLISMAGKHTSSASLIGVTCRWWFFRRVMYLAVSGRYASGQPLYNQAWRRLIRWMSRVRAPAGVVLCLSVKQLLQHDDKERHKAARNVRSQLEPLQMGLERRLPVYLLLTQGETLPGLERWQHQLTSAQREDVLGYFYLNQDDSSATERLNFGLTKMVECLRMNQLSLLNQQRQQPDADVLALPQTIGDLQGPLASYLTALFDNDHYVEHGLFRGIFLTAETPGKNAQVTGLFSQKLLGESLPDIAEQLAVEPLMGWRRIMKYGLCALAALILILCLIAGFSRTWQGMMQIKQVSEPTHLQQSYTRFALVEGWRHYTLPRMMFYLVNYGVEQRLARDYQQQTVNAQFNPQLAVETLLPRFRQANDQEKHSIAINWARFINIERAMAKGATLSELQQMPIYSAALLNEGSTSLSDEQRIAQRLALYRLGRANQNLALWQNTLGNMLETVPNWSWLLINDHPAGSRALLLTDFWPIAEGTSLPDNAKIRGLYTQPGEAYLHNVVNELAVALDQPARINAMQQQFWHNYFLSRQNEWLMFAYQMPQGLQQINGQKNWQSLVLKIGEYNSPYLTFLAKMESDLASVPHQDRQPWFVLQQKLWQLHSYAKKSNMLQRVSLGNISLRQRIMSRLGISPQLSINLDENALTGYRNYRQTLQSLSQRALTSQVEAEKLARESFENAPEKNDEQQLRSLFSRFTLWRQQTQSKQLEQGDEAIWQLYLGDASLLQNYVWKSAASRLQTAWATQVIWPVEQLSVQNLLSVQEMNARLYQYSTAFVRDTANYALNITPNGIMPQTLQGLSFPFKDDFILYINQLIRPDDVLASTPEIRRRLQEKLAILTSENESTTTAKESVDAKWADINISTQPATANPGARVLPIGSSVTLTCKESVQQLTSMNFSDKATFRWSPDECSQVEVKVTFPNFSVSKIYAGRTGLLQFMRAFATGEQIFAAQDFPAQHDELAALGIKNITARFQVNGQSELQALYLQWQLAQRAQSTRQQQHLTLENQLLNLSEPGVPKGTLSTLPAQITDGWN